MNLRVTVLGCGSSGGVPLVGERWGLCNPDEPKNRRRRASILMEMGETCVLVDTGPDVRNQLNDLARGEGGLKISAILYTHIHADHVAGIDDMRFQAYAQGQKIPAYADPICKEQLAERYDYIFKGIDGPRLSYKSILDLRLWPFELQIGSMAIHSWDQEHGNITSRGIRVGQFAYSTDVSDLRPEVLESLKGIDTWIVGCARKEPHPAHAHLDRVMTWAEIVQPRQLFLTHMTGLMDYHSLNAEMPDHMACAYDGLVLDIPMS